MIISLTEQQLDNLVRDIKNVFTGDCLGDLDNCHGGECPYIVHEEGGTTCCGQPTNSQRVYDLIKNAGKKP